MTPGEIDIAAAVVTEQAGFATEDVESPITIALGWLGDYGVVFVPGLPVAERAVFDGEVAQIQLRAGEAPSQSEWDCAHALGHVAASRFGWGLHGDALERACDMFAGALSMPRRPFLEALAEHPDDWDELAVLFGVSGTAAALRAGELTGRAIAVVGPLTVRARGEAQWTTDQLRAYRSRLGPGLVATALRDDPRRLVITLTETG